MKRSVLCLLLSVSCAGCTSTLDRLEKVGLQPELNQVNVTPEPQVKYNPAALSGGAPEGPVIRTANSLWQKGSKTFFRDQRARKVGDILTVKISIKDKAELDNKTERKRKTSDKMNAPALFGVEDKLFGALPGNAVPSALLNLSGDANNTGEGIVEREEVIETEIAAMVTKVLPNGNFLIHGSQEILVNFEVREISVQGIVRPEDISSKNLVALNQIAEARVTYGGRGHIMDVQQPRIGSQVVDILSPF